MDCTDYETKYVGTKENNFKPGFHPLTIMDCVINIESEFIDKSQPKHNLVCLPYNSGIAFYFNNEHLGNLLPVYSSEGKIEHLHKIFRIAELTCNCKQCNQ